MTDKCSLTAGQACDGRADGQPRRSLVSRHGTLQQTNTAVGAAGVRNIRRNVTAGRLKKRITTTTSNVSNNSNKGALPASLNSAKLICMQHVNQTLSVMYRHMVQQQVQRNCGQSKGVLVRTSNMHN